MPAQARAAGRAQDWGIAVLIVGAVLISFFPTLNNGFVDWDDTGMFTENFKYRGFSLAHVSWMFTTFHYGHYHPLTWLTLGLDYQLWGMNPKGYHLTSLLFHAASGVACYFLITALVGRQPAFSRFAQSLGFRLCCASGALFFALHPLRVESVAWATERRDVVSGLFYILTLLAYVRMSEKDSMRRRRWLVLALFFFTCSFLSKAWAITLPVVLLVLDVYPLRRIGAGEQFAASCQKVLLEKIPFVLIAVVFAWIAWLAQERWSIRAESFGVVQRLMSAAYSLCFYPLKTAVPVGLSPLYVLDPVFIATKPKYVLTALAVPAIAVVLVLMRRRWPWALAAGVCYAIIVSPVLGLAQSGEQIAADRYAYLSCLPFAILIAAGRGDGMVQNFGVLRWIR